VASGGYPQCTRPSTGLGFKWRQPAAGRSDAAAQLKAAHDVLLLLLLLFDLVDVHAMREIEISR